MFVMFGMFLAACAAINTWAYADSGDPLNLAAAVFSALVGLALLIRGE